MDLVEILPIEISHYILAFLPASDLINCFSVSKKWRDIVNSNYLWKRHCLQYATKKEILRAETKTKKYCAPPSLLENRYFLRPRTPSQICKLNEYCGCAELYKHKYRKLLRTWRTGQYKTYRLSHTEGLLYDVMLCSDSAALCFCSYQPPRLAIAHLGHSSLDSLYFVNLPLPQWGRFESVFLSPTYLAVASRNMVLVLRNHNQRYCLWKAYSCTNNSVVPCSFLTFVCSEYHFEGALTIGLLCDHFLWLSASFHIHVVDLLNGTVRHLRADYSWIIKNERRVVAKLPKDLRIYSLSGDIIHTRDLKSTVKDLVFNDEYVVFSRVKKRQYFLEIWEPKTNERKIVKRVETNSHLAMYKEMVFVVECRWERYQTVTCVDMVSGATRWEVEVGSGLAQRAGLPLGRTIFQTVADRFLLLHTPLLHHNKYTVLHIPSGKSLYQRDIGIGKLFFANPKFMVVSRENQLEVMHFL